MPYTPPSGFSADLSWVGVEPYVAPAGDAATLSWVPTGTGAKVFGHVLGPSAQGLATALLRVPTITLALSGIAKFTDGAVASLARVWRRDDGSRVADLVPDGETAVFAIQDLERTGYDVTIFRDGYRPLTHGPVRPYVKVIDG